MAQIENDYKAEGYFKALCSRQHIIKVYPNPLSVLHIEDQILNAVEKCPECLDRKAYKTTRFPEGAEL